MYSKCVGKWSFAAHGATHFEYPLKGIRFNKISINYTKFGRYEYLEIPLKRAYLAKITV